MAVHWKILPHELDERLTYRDRLLLETFYPLEPWGPDESKVQLAMIGACLLRQWGDADVLPGDFMRGQAEEAPVMDWRTMRAMHHAQCGFAG